MPISQVSQQLNSIVMAQAGAKRVFDLLDEKVETDEGYVTLVRAKKVDGKIVECPESEPVCGHGSMCIRRMDP